MSSRFVDAAGCRLAYSLQGTGEPVLFIQGVGIHGDGWLPQIGTLRQKYQCLSFDNRGIGKSQPIGESLTIDRMIEDVRAIMEDAGWQSAHVVGHSLGGLVALGLAIRDPAKSRSLALLCTFADGRAAAPLTLRMSWLGLRSVIGSRRMRRRGFLGLLYAPGARELREPERVAAELKPIFGHDLADQPSVIRRQLRAMRQADFTDRLPQLTGIPTLIVCGRHDPIAPPRLGRILASGIASAQYYELADAAHGVPISHAEWLNSRLDEHFLSTGERHSTD